MAKFNKRHIEYLNDPVFLQRYLLLLNSRLVYSNNRIEFNNKEIDRLYDNAHVLSLEDNFKAFNILLTKLNKDEDKRLTQELIKKVANTINAHAMYISNDYRKLGDDVNFEEKYPIEKAKNISKKMELLLTKYYNEWEKLELFEKEALFNIEFLRIHPFEDGNGRTSRLILNYNIMLNGHAPILIPVEKREKYFTARNKKDVKWIKNLFEEESKKELKSLDILINNYELEKNYSKQKRK